MPEVVATTGPAGRIRAATRLPDLMLGCGWTAFWISQRVSDAQCVLSGLMVEAPRGSDDNQDRGAAVEVTMVVRSGGRGPSRSRT